MSNQSLYRQFCRSHKIPVYLQPDWLDIVAGTDGNWDAVFSLNTNGEVQGFWVYMYKKQWVWTKITMPPYTPYMGPRLLYPENLNEYERISFENRILEDLINQIPEFDEIKFKWSLEYKNWLPFYWKNFLQQTAYTYLIKNTEDSDKVFLGFKSSIQRQIRKAEKKIHIKIAENSEGVIQMFTQSMKDKENFIVNSKLLTQLHQIALHHNQALILEAYDSMEKLHAAIYLITDDTEMLYLYGGYDETYGDSGAMPLLFWKALQIAGERKLTFNFEGSMLKGVERFFRSFGGEQTPVFTIQKKKFPYSLKK